MSPARRLTLILPRAPSRFRTTRSRWLTGTGGTTKDIPVKNAQYMIDEATFSKEVRSNPGFFYGWNGLDHRGRDAGGGDAEQPQLYRRGSAGKDYSHA